MDRTVFNKEAAGSINEAFSITRNPKRGRRMNVGIRIAAMVGSILMASAISSSALMASETAQKISTTDKGVIFVCRDWNLMTKSCRAYHHVSLPPMISVGDMIKVEYGSNLKTYQFTVGRIEVKDGICRIYRPKGQPPRDRIKVACPATDVIERAAK